MRRRHGLILLFVLLALAAGSGREMLSAQASQPVTILVVDDFTGAAVNTTATPPSSTNCAVSLEGQGYATRGASSTSLPVPHGEIVFEELQRLVTEQKVADTITLVRVDVHDDPTDQVADAINGAIGAQSGGLFVVNMSFAIIPCEFISAFKDFDGQLQSAQAAGDNNRYRGLFQRAVTFYDQTVFPVNSKRFQAETDLDPLQAVLSTLSDRVIGVAASGNFGLKYPFWPGAWSQVISVSASTGDGFDAPSSWDKRRETPLLPGLDSGPRSRPISNYGEVMLPGEFLSTVGPVSGTSFAAPRLSFLMALYLSRVGTNFCRNAVNGPGLAYGRWNNLTVREVASAYCPDFAMVLPP